MTVAHLQAALTASPSRVEREVAGLVDKGIVTRVVIRGRSEAVVRVGDLLDIVEKAGVGEGSRAAYGKFILGRGEGGGEIGAEGLERGRINILIKAFLLHRKWPFRSRSSYTGGARE